MALTTGAWHSFVGGYDTVNNILFMYIDGGAKQTIAMPNVKVASSGFAVGLFFIRSVGNELKGKVDEFAVWHNRILNDTDAANYWNGGAGLPFSSYTT